MIFSSIRIIYKAIMPKLYNSTLSLSSYLKKTIFFIYYLDVLLKKYNGVYYLIYL